MGGSVAVCMKRQAQNLKSSQPARHPEPESRVVGSTQGFEGNMSVPISVIMHTYCTTVVRERETQVDEHSHWISINSRKETIIAALHSSLMLPRVGRRSPPQLI